MIKRLCDIILALISITIFIIPYILIWIGIRITSSGPGIYWSKRVGQNSVYFMMPKFRTMYLNAPELPKNEISNPKKYITPIGHLLRQTSLDEIPQIYSVLIGQMSIVGPRPALFNEYELIDKREEIGINILRPGITGLAQVNGRDKNTLLQKIEYDQIYLKNQSLLFDLKIIIKTFILVLKANNVSH